MPAGMLASPCCKKDLQFLVRGEWFVTSADCLRQTLERDLEDGPYNDKNKKQPNDTEAEVQAA